VDLDHIVDRDAGDAEGGQHLVHELVTGWLGHVRWRAQPCVELLSAGLGDAEHLPGPGFLPAVVGLDQLVTLEALERRIDLPDVEGPRLAVRCLMIPWPRRPDR